MNTKTRILKKIQLFLQTQPMFEKDQELVYLLVEIRKVLEIDNIQNSIIRFYCNWILHSDLRIPKTTQIISNIFDPSINTHDSGKDIAKILVSKHADFFKLDNFKSELLDFFKNNGLPSNSIHSWSSFKKSLVRVIEETPVVFAGTSKIIELKLLKDKVGYQYKFTLKHGGRPPVVKLSLN